MTSLPVLKSQQSFAQSVAATTVGNWKLGAGRATTLRSHDEGVLRIAKGRVWATLDGPRIGPVNDSGDFFLDVGDSLTLRAGQPGFIACANVDPCVAGGAGAVVG